MGFDTTKSICLLQMYMWLSFRQEVHAYFSDQHKSIGGYKIGPVRLCVCVLQNAWWGMMQLNSKYF